MDLERYYCVAVSSSDSRFNLAWILILPLIIVYKELYETALPPSASTGSSL